MDTQSTVQLRTANTMPILGLGTWQLTNDTASAVAHALELGYRMIDTSGNYGTQPGIGQGIKQSDISRDQLYIVTKVEETDNAYEATRKNLTELQLDYVDLMLIHRPPASGAGLELWQGLQRAKQEGLTRDIGVSNYDIERLQLLINASGEVPTVNQIEWSPFGHSMDMLEFARQNAIIIQAYSPLTRGTQLSNEVIHAIGAKYGKTPAQVLIRWNLQMGVVPIIKANQRAHQEENIAVFDFTLSDEDMNRLSSLNQQYSSLGELPYV